MRVFVYPENTMEELGAERWTVSWWTVRHGCEDKEEIDFDSDLLSHPSAYKTRAAALRAAKRVAANSFFGCAQVERQRVDWFVEEDRIAEWSGAGSVEEIMA